MDCINPKAIIGNLWLKVIDIDPNRTLLPLEIVKDWSLLIISLNVEGFSDYKTIGKFKN